jgi:hypothetical protein
MTIWHVDVDRVRLTGARVTGLGADELHGMIERAVRHALEGSPLPAGRAVSASVEVRVASLGDGAAVARAVGQGVSRAVGGRTNG